MADYIEVDINNLKADIAGLEVEVNQIRSQLQTMFDEIIALDKMWDGPANMAFNVQFMNDHQMMLELCTTVDSIISFVENARSEYINCENAVSSAIDEIKI